MRSASYNNARRGFEPRGMVLLHATSIAIHTIIWGKRVLAVPPVTSERPTELHS
jgi:hypothetical protein